MRNTTYRKYTSESFANKLQQINSNIELLSDYTKATDTIKAKCKLCRNIWYPKACSLLQGRGCPKCSHKRGAKNNAGATGLKSFDKFVNELIKVNSSIEVIGEYINTHTDIECRCTRCEHIWKAKPYALLQGHGCPRCAKSGTSFMEQLILLSFRDVIGDEGVLSRDKSLIGMELDIVIPRFGLAIEPGNWFLHKRSITRDEQKRNRCREKGIRLITIYDKFPRNMKSPFEEDCYVYCDDLNIADHSLIHELIYALFNECRIEKTFSDSEWQELELHAYANSKSITHEEFIDKLFAISPNIEVIGKYENANRRIEVRCKKCGFSWKGIPASLLEGDGCRKCGAKKRGEAERKKHEEFEEELGILVPTIKVMSSYIGRHKPIKVQCLKCGSIWETTPGSLLRREHMDSTNNGCPSCCRKTMGTPKKRVENVDTGEVFESAIEAGEKYNIVPSAIRQCCRGISQSSKGYHWRYLE